MQQCTGPGTRSARRRSLARCNAVSRLCSSAGEQRGAMESLADRLLLVALVPWTRCRASSGDNGSAFADCGAALCPPRRLARKAVWSTCMCALKIPSLPCPLRRQIHVFSPCRPCFILLFVAKQPMRSATPGQQEATSAVRATRWFHPR
jgi:hypothetical protein